MRGLFDRECGRWVKIILGNVKSVIYFRLICIEEKQMKIFVGIYFCFGFLRFFLFFILYVGWVFGFISCKILFVVKRSIIYKCKLKEYLICDQRIFWNILEVFIVLLIIVKSSF